MKVPARGKRFSDHPAAVIYFAAAIFLFIQPIFACSWDYPIWQNRSRNADALYRFIAGGKAGYIDRNGKIVVKPTLDFYGNTGDEFHNGLLETGIGYGDYIDASGKAVTKEDDFYRGWEFSDGLAAAQKNDGDKWGYIDRAGKFVISPRFEYNYLTETLSSFSDGLAAIEIKDKYGYIDRAGEFVIEPQFLHGADFQEGLARVAVEGPCAYFDYDDPCEFFNPPQALPSAARDRKPPLCKFTFIDKKGAIITAERFERAENFAEGLAAVMKNGKWGFIDKQGRTVIEPQFDEAGSFSDGLALVTTGELKGYINRKGEIVIRPQFKTAQSFSDNLAAVGKNWNEKKFDYDDYYFIDKSGKQAFPETFALASHFFKGLAHVKLKTKQSQADQYNYNYKGTFAYIDTKGKKVFVYERKSGDDD
jgi:hypothetical protein